MFVYEQESKQFLWVRKATGKGVPAPFITTLNIDT